MLTLNAAHCTIISENDLVMFIRESKWINCNFPNTIANTNIHDTRTTMSISSVATIVLTEIEIVQKKLFIYV